MREKDIVIKRDDGLYAVRKGSGVAFGFTDLANATHYTSNWSAKRDVTRLEWLGCQGLRYFDLNNVQEKEKVTQ